jgi:hypothetical protein
VTAPSTEPEEVALAPVVPALPPMGNAAPSTPVPPVPSGSAAALPVAMTEYDSVDDDWNTEPVPVQPFQYRAPPISPPPPLQAIDWGRGHPDYENTTSRRIRWTEAEYSYVAQWLDRFGDRPSAMAACLAHMQKDPDAIRIFHRNHTIDSTRLQHIKKNILAKQGIV